MNQGDYKLDSSLIGATAIVNHFLARLGLDDALERTVARRRPTAFVRPRRSAS